MTVADMISRIITRLDDDSAAPVSTSAVEVLAAINEAQQFAALLTLWLEKTVDYSLGTATFYTPRSILSDYLVPLKLTVGGVRLRPSTLAELDAYNSAWQATAGTPERYAAIGCNLLAVTKQSATNVTARFTYANSPTDLASNGTPVLPVHFHPSLVEYGVYRIKLKEGAQGLARGLRSLNLFLDDMTLLGDFTRAKSRAARYDVQPFELARFDRSKLVDSILKLHAHWAK